MGPIHLIANPNVCLSLLLNARKQSTPVSPCESCRAIVKYTSRCGTVIKGVEHISTNLLVNI